jgi:hypothetical protein
MKKDIVFFAIGLRDQMGMVNDLSGVLNGMIKI